jgi:lipopolysaccharide transport system permease protein
MTNQKILILEPEKKFNLLDLKELWAYRELLWVLTARDIKVRYKQTILGIAWAVIQPVMIMIVFSIFFGRLAKVPSEGFPYPVFVYAGLLPWTFFANAISQSSNSIISSTNLITKIYFPRLIIPLSSIGAGIVDFLISTVILLLLMLYYGVAFTSNLLFAPLLLLAVIFIALGIGSWLAALNVSFRDFRYVIPFMIQVWLFITPVIYPTTMIPEKWHWLYYLNPMAGLIEGFRSAFLGKPFDIVGPSISFSVAIACFIIGVLYFRKVERRFADII